MRESKPLVSATNRSECRLESTILVWASFRSIRHKIGAWRACCELAMGRDRNRANLVDGGMVLVMGQDAGGCFAHSQGRRRMSSGDRSGVRVRVRSSPGRSSVLRSFPGLRLDALIHSRSLVLVLVLVVVVRWFWFWWWWMRRYAPPIWCDDMHRRYAPPICKAGKQKRPRAYCSWPLMLFAFVIRYFCFLTHFIIFPISVGTIPAIKSWSCTRPMCSTSVSHS